MSKVNINDNFFEGHYKKIWKDLIPAELTQKELDFMVPYFELKKGSSILDLMCGHGRHTLGLARKGIKVTAIDNLAEYIDEIKATAEIEALPIQTIKQSILDLQAGGNHDLAICMGNSLQFFDAEDLSIILEVVSKSLKKGGHLLINSWSIAEISIRNFKEEVSSPMGEFQFNAKSTWHFSPSRIEIQSSIISPDGSSEDRNSVDYIYSLNEMEWMLKEGGFKMKEVYSIPGRKKFSFGEARAYIVAENVGNNQ